MVILVMVILAKILENYGFGMDLLGALLEKLLDLKVLKEHKD